MTDSASTSTTTTARPLAGGPEPLVVLEGPDTRILHASGPTEKLLGAPAEALLGNQLDTYLHPEDEGVLRQAREGLKGWVRFEGRLRRADGAWARLQGTLHALPAAKASDARCLAIFHDATEAHRATEAERLAFERRLMIEHLRQLDRTRSEMVGTAAHELRTPLLPISLQLEMLRRGDLGALSAEQEEVLTLVDRNVRRLRDLLDDMLDVARIGTGSLQIEPLVLDMGEVLGDTMAMFQEQAQRGNVELRMETDGDLRVQGDPRRLHQVLVNLVSNALKFTPPGGRVLLRAGGGEDVDLEVHDTGPGLSEKQVARLFQPFHRVHEGADAPGGAGLGLYISRGVVEAHGGRIWCEGRGASGGCVFHVRLPRTAPDRSRA